jgi:hypothetical protein
MTEKITLEQAVKSKDNFTKFIEENSEECIKSALKGCPQRSLHIVIPQMTPTADGLLNGVAAFKDGQKCYVFWFILNEKEEIIQMAETLNTRFSKICGIYIFKPCLTDNKTEFKCLLKPELSKRPPANPNTKSKQLQYQLWELYREVCDGSEYPDMQIAEAHPRHYEYVSIQVSGLQMIQTINTQNGYVASELSMRSREKFEKLKEHKDEIEKEIGELIWDDNEKKDTVKIRKTFPIDVYATKNHKKAVTKLIEIGAELKNIAHKYLDN